MKVILIKDVAKVGRAYEVKDLSDGYARNFIISRGLGLPATEAVLARLEKERAQQKIKTEAQITQIKKMLQVIKNSKVKILAKANEEGHLFAGIHETEIVEALKKQAHIDLPAQAIILEQPIKTLGEFVIKIKTIGEFPLIIERLPS